MKTSCSSYPDMHPSYRDIPLLTRTSALLLDTMPPVDGGVEDDPHPLEGRLQSLVAGPGVKLLHCQIPQPVNKLYKNEHVTKGIPI